MSRKLVLIVIDGLTPVAFERAVEGRRAPALAFLAEHGRYARGVSTFPSLTPVCLSSIATGGHPDGHRIPHLVWYHRGEQAGAGADPGRDPDSVPLPHLRPV